MCLELGVQHPDDLDLTVNELNEWMAYDKVEPIGSYRTDIMLGSIMALVIDIFKKGRTPTDPLKLIPWINKDNERVKEMKESKILTKLSLNEKQKLVKDKVLSSLGIKENK